MDDSLRVTGDRADIIRKVTRRLIPLVGICYLIAYISIARMSAMPSWRW